MTSTALSFILSTADPHQQANSNDVTNDASSNDDKHISPENEFETFIPDPFDPADYGKHADVMYYPDDVSHLVLPWVREPNFAVLVLVYTLTFVLGILGNSLVINVLCCRKTGRCVTFPCLLSMAWSDILFLVVCAPHEIVGYFLTHWGLSSFLCKLSGFVKMASALAATLNLILISVER